jgi:hypothetical protein
MRHCGQRATAFMLMPFPRVSPLFLRGAQQRVGRGSSPEGPNAYRRFGERGEWSRAAGGREPKAEPPIASLRSMPSIAQLEAVIFRSLAWGPLMRPPISNGALALSLQQDVTIKIDDSFTGPVCDYSVGFLKFGREGNHETPHLWAPAPSSSSASCTAS